MLYAFGEFELNADAHELRRAGEKKRVQPKVFQLLRYLVENRDRLIPKEELLAAVWPEEHVTESSLFVAVRAARAALDQPHGANRPIHTLRGVGYRFADEVQLQAGSRHAAAPARSVRPASPSKPWDTLVGRHSAMRALSEALTRAGEGHGRLALLSGESGIGKTRCAEAVSELAEARAMRVLDARCLETDGAPPFWPFIQLVRRLAPSADTASAVEARALLAALTTDASAAEAGQGPRTGGEIERFWILDRSVAVLRQLLRAAPSVLVIDDLQWADESSLRLLQLFAAELERLPCLVVCTLREPRTNPDPARERLLLSLRRNALVLELSGLSQAETEELVGVVARDQDAAELGAELHRRTAGNPLFLREMLRLYLESPQSSGLSLPRVVRDVIRGRLDELSGTAREVLRAASVLGLEFDVTLLQQVSTRASDELFAAFDAALDARLLTTTDNADCFAFTHDLVRAALHDELNHAERVRLHLRAGEALESRGGDGFQGEAAYHFAQALGGGAHEKALRLAAAAGRAAMRLSAYDSAARYLRWALDALDRHPKDAPRLRAELTVDLGAAVFTHGRSTEARELFRAAAAIAESHGYGDLLALTATWMRQNITMAPMPDALALQVLERALDLLEPDQQLWRVHVLSRLSWIWPNCQDMPTCKRLASEALSLARTLQSRAALLSALAARLYALSGPDDIEELLETAAEVIEIERRTGRPTWSSAQAHMMRYHAYLLSNRRSEADAALDEFGALVRRQKLTEATLWHDRMVAQRALYQGKLDEAEAAFLEQHARAKRLGLVYADLYLGAQALALAWERVGLRELNLAAPTDTWNIPSTPAFRAVKLVVMTSTGVSAEARAEWLALSQDDFAAVPKDLMYLNALGSLTQVAITLRDVPRAEQLYALLTPYAGYGTPTLLSHVLGSVDHFLGTLCRFLGRTEEAVAHFEHALALHERMGYAPWIARTRIALAETLRQPGPRRDPTRAHALASEARQSATALGLGPTREQAEALL